MLRENKSRKLQKESKESFGCPPYFISILYCRGCFVYDELLNKTIKTITQTCDFERISSDSNNCQSIFSPPLTTKNLKLYKELF